jgi:dipeptidyl aminopeptidase/acylaminoacyl peptidase
MNAMGRDLRETDTYRQAEALCRAVRSPGTGQISEAAEIHAAPDGRRAVFSGTLFDKLEGAPGTRICLVELTTGDTRVLTYGPNTDRLAKFSPDGTWIAFLSDRHRAGDFQLYLLEPASGAARAAPAVNGWVEYLQWSPDGAHILLGVAGHGADIAGGQGAISSKQIRGTMPSWMPAVKTADESYLWRRLWVYCVADQSVRQLGSTEHNVWEAAWCGTNTVAAVVSPGPGEGLWYSARVRLLDINAGGSREIYSPRDQVGIPAGSPSGQQLAVVEAVCSDRWLVAGDLRIIDTSGSRVQSIDTWGVNVTTIEWRSECKLLLAGIRGPETVVGICDLASGKFTEIWSSQDVSTAGYSINISGLNDDGDCVLIGEGFTRAPEVAFIRGGEYRCLRSFDLDTARNLSAVGQVRSLQWNAPDGLSIQGWLLEPRAAGPHPVVMLAHGGPVYHWRPIWLGRPRGIPQLMLIQRGFAIFLPNPRGSSGRGQDFARHVVGDMGGADTYDCLSGLDYLVGQEIADPKRLGVMGVSYGGFMTAWLITQDPRFAAAVAVSPVTNQVTQHLISNIPDFVRLFLADEYINAGGKYFQRSPVMHAHKVKTPTLNICGALDRCTPPEEAVQFHNALLENGAKSVLVTYPEEGHGVRSYPAVIDYATRVTDWFCEHVS